MIPLIIPLLAIAASTALATAILGVFLILRGVALMSDAISHAILPGIVIMFCIVQDLSSPWLIIGAALAGIATVFLTEVLINTHRLKKDSAIGIVFPLFFSIGIIAISMYARNVHLDLDMVLLGELIFAPFNRLIIGQQEVGPAALWSMGSIAFINTLFVTLWYKQLQITIFDPLYATTVGISPRRYYYAQMTLTSITAVGAFNIVGSVVVVALMIIPAATAYLITSSLPSMIALSLYFGIMGSWSGYALAHTLNVSVAGSMAAMCGLIFLIILLISAWYKHRKTSSQCTYLLLLLALISY
jgi:manganese/zinc/iron transport system permease protein